MLRISGIGKQYKGDVWGVQDLDLEIGPGVLGLVGPNGAGKSTLMRILATVTKATTGTAKWDGTDIARSPNRIRKILGYLPQDFGVYPNLNALEFLSYLAAARGIGGVPAKRRINELLEIVNLVDARKRPLGSLSGGMRQRVGIAQALLNDPALLIVDEPTAGLDPEERVRFRNLLAEISGDRVVILSSHIVSDIEAAATSIAVLNNGQLLSHALPEEMLKAVDGKVWERTIPSAEVREVASRYVVSGTTRTSDGVRMRVVADDSPGSGARPLTPTLEDAYLYMLSSRSVEAH
jgi:ABC-type multidrug transport system ATPase subunit